MEVAGNVYWEEVQPWLNNVCKMLPFEVKVTYLHTGCGVCPGTVGVAFSSLELHLSNFDGLSQVQKLIFSESLGMIR